MKNFSRIPGLWAKIQTSNLLTKEQEIYSHFCNIWSLELAYDV